MINTKQIKYRNEIWTATTERNLNGTITINVESSDYPVIEKLTTDNINEIDNITLQLIDNILDNYFWNIAE